MYSCLKQSDFRKYRESSQDDERAVKDMAVSIAVPKLGLEWSNCRAKLKECDPARGTS